jgi:hypothetical protein
VSFTVLVPARLASTRLPDKPLADIAGLPMVVRVAMRAGRSGASRVVVAADHASIVDACRAHEVAAAAQVARMDARVHRRDRPVGEREPCLQAGAEVRERERDPDGDRRGNHDWTESVPDPVRGEVEHGQPGCGPHDGGRCEGHPLAQANAVRLDG